jgi:predicted ATPase
VLGVQGEVTWLVPPLSVPPMRADLTPKAVASSESGRLFLDRACAAVPTFRLSEHNALDVGHVCQRLDGIPLALELAAARVKVLTVGQIAERLDHALGLLTTGGRLAPARQQTLRATLAWSYQLLSEPEQRLFERLSVFGGGLTLDAAEAVCAGENVEPAWVLDGLGRLFDKSLLVVQEPASGDARYRLLEPIRQFAEEQLVARGEHHRFKDRHADFYVALAERSEPEIHRPSALAVMDMLDREHDNMRVALRWLLSIPDAERSQRLAGGMGGFWLYGGGHIAEGEAWLWRALDVPGGDAPTLQRAKCLSPMPVFANTRGDLTRLEQTSQEELRVCRQIRNQVGEAFALLHVAQAAVMRGDLDQAQRCFLYGVEVSRAIGSTAAETLNLVGLAKLAFEQGFDDEARAYAEGALGVVSEEGWTRGLAQARRILGQVCHRQGDHARARALLETSLEFSRRFGARWWTCGTLIELGNFAVDQRDATDARALLSEALQLAYELGDSPGLVAGLEGFGRLAVALGQPLDGLRLYAAADAIRRQRALPGVGPLEQSITAVRASSGQSTADSALAEGRGMRVQESVDYALRF